MIAPSDFYASTKIINLNKNKSLLNSYKPTPSKQSLKSTSRLIIFNQVE